VLGYLRAYASAVGLDPDDVVLRYEEAAGEARERSPKSKRRAVPPLAAALVIALAVAGCAVWAWLRW
jgi:cytoskeletal protein RodZ